MKTRKTCLFLLAAMAFASCSTQPKNPGDILELRMRSESRLEVGSKEANRGNFEAALVILDESKRLAVITDDPGLLIRTGLARGNVLFSLDRRDEATAEWDGALAEAKALGNRELIAVCNVHIQRGRLLSGISAQEALDEITREREFIKTDKKFIAFSWLVAGLAQRELGRFADAEACVKRSLDIHIGSRQLEEAAYDWFVIGSIRSLSGNFDGALQALDNALELDRRVENSWGLASDWRARGDIYNKAGKHQEAVVAWLRSASIYRALGNESEARSLEEKAGEAALP
jgi:tetratricopeptide (TPR) repeat protein